MKFKKSLWALGSLTLITTPVAAIVSCSEEQDPKINEKEKQVTPVTPTVVQSSNLIIDTLKSILTGDSGQLLGSISVLLGDKSKLEKAADELTISNIKIEQSIFDEAKKGDGSSIFGTVKKYLAILLEKKLVNPTQTDVDSLKGLVKGLFIEQRSEVLGLVSTFMSGKGDDKTTLGKFYNSVITPIQELLTYIQKPENMNQETLEFIGGLASLFYTEKAEKLQFITTLVTLTDFATPKDKEDYLVNLKINQPDFTDADIESIRQAQPDPATAGIASYIPLISHLSKVASLLHNVVISLLDLFDETKNPGYIGKFENTISGLLKFLDPNLSAPDFVRDIMGLVGGLIKGLYLPNSFLVNDVISPLLSVFGVDANSLATKTVEGIDAYASAEEQLVEMLQTIVIKPIVDVTFGDVATEESKAEFLKLTGGTPGSEINAAYLTPEGIFQLPAITLLEQAKFASSDANSGLSEDEVHAKIVDLLKNYYVNPPANHELDFTSETVRRFDDLFRTLNSPATHPGLKETIVFSGLVSQVSTETQDQAIAAAKAAQFNAQEAYKLAREAYSTAADEAQKAAATEKTAADAKKAEKRKELDAANVALHDTEKAIEDAEKAKVKYIKDKNGEDLRSLITSITNHLHGLITLVGSLFFDGDLASNIPDNFIPIIYALIIKQDAVVDPEVLKARTNYETAVANTKTVEKLAIVIAEGEAGYAEAQTKLAEAREKQKTAWNALIAAQKPIVSAWLK